ncbi:MAG: cyclic nucleotide-binding domain-containing protein, partial [Steroidobacteraceae bacterium]|nr:cyclic nucleotide-binding domain-containing protein [Steroidobacteraceae bacterium]
MEGDVPEDTLAVRGDIRLVLAGLPIFQGLDPEAIDALAAGMEWLSLPGGAPLFHAGEAADAMYVVLSGSLATLASENPRDRRRFVARIGTGETVGEMGLISGRARSA